MSRECKCHEHVRAPEAVSDDLMTYDVAMLCVQLRALDKKASKPEKIKNAKGGHRITKS